MIINKWEDSEILLIKDSDIKDNKITINTWTDDEIFEIKKDSNL